MLVDCFNQSFMLGKLSTSQRQAIITLLEKPGKDKTLIENWRPISLNNVDYKILTKILASRIKPILPSIIHPNQTGYVNGRQIFHSVRLLQDIMDISVKKNIHGMLIFIDFLKAFDTLEWDFMFKALEHFNFGNQYIAWVKMIYNDISSSIINNSVTSPYFSLSRGVRQGDPLSGYLFIIALEILAQKIRDDKRIEGFKIDNVEIKLTQYVDDMTVVCKDRHSGDALFEILSKFRSISGLGINVKKSEGMGIGLDKSTTNKLFGIKWPNDPIKVLGIHLSYDVLAAEKANFDDKIKQLKLQLHWWKARDLTLIGRILIAKSIGLSKFIYLASVIDIPQNIVSEVNAIIYDFIWKGKKDKVSRKILMQDCDEGGFKMFGFDIIIKSLRVKWIKQYLDQTLQADWKQTFESQCQKVNLSLFLRSNFRAIEIKHCNNFYKKAIEDWREVKLELDSNKEELNGQFIWYNTNITIGRTTVYDESLLKAGLWSVNDLYETGKLIPFHVWQKRGVDLSSYLTWQGIIRSIPPKWKIAIKSEFPATRNIPPCCVKIGQHILNLENMSTKDFKKIHALQHLIEKSRNRIQFGGKYPEVIFQQ